MLSLIEQLSTHSPSVTFMKAAARWHSDDTELGAFMSRSLCVAVAATAIAEAVAHGALATFIVGGSLARKVIVLSLTVLSWALAAGHLFVMKWALDVGNANWAVRILTELAVLVTRPLTFLAQWKDRIRVIFWAITRDRWLWNLSKAVEKKFAHFLNFTHGWHHTKQAMALTVAAVAMPTIGIANPALARRKFKDLGIEPEGSFHRFRRLYGMKIAVVACAVAILSIDYLRSGQATPRLYGEHLANLACKHLGPKWASISTSGRWFGEMLYNQIFYERLDYSLMNRKNRAVAEVMEAHLVELKAPKSNWKYIIRLFR